MNVVNGYTNGDVMANGCQYQVINGHTQDGVMIKRIGKSLLKSSSSVISSFRSNLHNVVLKKEVINRLNTLPKALKDYVEDKVKIMQPDRIQICDGSEEEYNELITEMKRQGVIEPLAKLENSYLALTDPKDVARVESKTLMSTDNQLDTIPTPKKGFAETNGEMLKKMKRSELGNWMSKEDLQEELNKRLPGCMKGRTMYIIPFSMGPLNGPISKIGIELTDSPYVVCSMRIMTRMGKEVLTSIEEGKDFVKCLHTVGVPLPAKKPIVNNWPCNPEMTLVSHIPDYNEVISFGSGYGGNSLLGKKCFALRLGSILAKREGWFAEHMLISSLTSPEGKKIYFAAAFPSACGKTNLAMLTPTIPGWKVECVGDDIAWMKFDKDGVLRAINPENGFFGVAPGTSMVTNPNAMRTIRKNTLFTNTAMTEDGDVYWEGIDETEELKGKKIISWKGKEWTKESGEPSAHPNSRFCAPAKQCPIMDPAWESAEGVPISAIIFGGRRPRGVPLIYESFNWQHGVFVGASVSSETTAAAEHKGTTIMHDPFAMRPFFGYNFGHYCGHWLSQNKDNRKMPKIFHVNWFKKSNEGKGSFLWPGFGENARVLEWIFRRVQGEQDIQIETPIGLIPKPGSINVEGLDLASNAMNELFEIKKDFWLDEVKELHHYFEENVNESLPKEIYNELDELEERLKSQ